MSDTITAHFVTFYSPGTFVSEQSQQPIDGWNIEAAKAMALTVSERYGATPYAFRFSTRSRGPADLDSKTSAASGLYYLGGTILTLAEVEARGDERDRILISNMRCNGYERVIENRNSWLFTGPLSDGDTVLDFTPPPRKSEA
jgi:hypothetical protein